MQRDISCRWQMLRIVQSIHGHLLKTNGEPPVQRSRPINNLLPSMAGQPRLQNRFPLQVLKNHQPQFRRKVVLEFIFQSIDSHRKPALRAEPKQTRFGRVGRE
uniref:(northern house mosquito) hypothetical protein n=1 Tax=Culex pipiens TaxID=7175 RepID=A0A8D8K9Z8_CULPI